MDSFAGNQLKEMTEMRFARKQHPVLISSGVATVIFLEFALYYYFNHQPLSSGLLLLSGIVTLLNMISLNRHRELHTRRFNSVINSAHLCAGLSQQCSA